MVWADSPHCTAQAGLMGEQRSEFRSMEAIVNLQRVYNNLNGGVVVDEVSYLRTHTHTHTHTHTWVY